MRCAVRLTIEKRKKEMEQNLLTIRKLIIAYCLTFENVYEDYPFDDPNWCVIRHGENKKVFVWIFEKEGHIWVNVKCAPEEISFWRNAFTAVVPAFHLNKAHWNSIILDGTIPDQDIEIMIGNSYDLTCRKEHSQTSGHFSIR